MHTLDQLHAGQLRGVTRLDLSAGLTEFPDEIFALADSLEVLNLSGNALSTLPADLGRLRRLRVLFCSDNRFTEVPAVLGECPELSMVGFKANRIRTLPAAALGSALRWLILTDNELEELPAEIGRCGQLQKLMLAGNRLDALPDTLAQCGRLELLRIAANRLAGLPGWLAALPRLSWLAYAGNPFCEHIEAAAVAAAPAAAIDWSDLTVGERLGEGASGVIYRAQWRRPGAAAGLAEAEVAVKLFKGAVTSDGLPRSELAACIGAGTHSNLVAVLGRVARHPAGADGLVFELIDPAFGNLAGPPSLESCTRDVYPAGARYSLETAVRVAAGVASAAGHLHARGIIHGDLYAHNILTTLAGEARLADFGAAGFFDPADVATATTVQRIEARAFGCLLEELLDRCPEANVAAGAGKALRDLQRRCAQPQGAARPSFAEIVAVLAAA
jgi:hypothetical protein